MINRGWLSSSLHKTAGIAALTSMLFGSAASSADGPRYCRNFNPSITYLQVDIPKSLQPKWKPGLFDGVQNNSPAMELARANAGSPIHFSAAAIKFATISSFIEQLAITVVAKDDPFLNSLKIRPMEKSVQDAMGFGARGSRLVEPGEDLPNYSDVRLELVDVDDTGAYADSLNNITIKRGLVDRIVSGAVKKAYGGVEGYKLHLREVLALTDPPPGLVVDAPATDVSIHASYTVKDGNVASFPIGEVIENAFNENKQDNPFFNIRVFAQQVVGQLVFIGAHEVGHIRNGHRASKANTCERFSEQERQADAYAAGVLANFQFDMAGGDGGGAPLNDWSNFFQYYRDSGLTDTDSTTGCRYEAPDKRQAWVEKAYQVAWGHLLEITYSSADYTTPNPTSSICSDGMTSWRQSVE